ncbi:J domain-containing protein CG6693 [Contarinia nasturtii]|uniref:J domain-containing protein CG6693 n=1 Tax=Contarinia nasturtii TaxID=265458 RepID=UPI0012D491F2|nr:J domain-containing protein CG6693 [Contarinia nasturtii]XP_031632579.1 J domain-containing protein CG6693 [Contarinia nasturtii]
MPTTLELCEKYFGTKDIYKLMNLTKDSLEKDVKKAYYKLSLQVHPDRVSESEKEDATEKFKVLTKINAVLTDPDKKALYDQQGIIDDDGDSDCNWLKLWREFFKPITTTDIENFHQKYIGSETEERDIRKAYLGGKGCINFMMNSVPFMTVEDEPRIMEKVKEWISSGELPEYEQFTNEPKAKRNRRHKKYAREAKESEVIKADMAKKSKMTGTLEQQIMKRQSEREQSSNSFFDRLLEKYGDADDSEEYVFPAKRSKKTTAKKTTTKDTLNKVKNGRVSKKKI